MESGMRSAARLVTIDEMNQEALQLFESKKQELRNYNATIAEAERVMKQMQEKLEQRQKDLEDLKKTSIMIGFISDDSCSEYHSFVALDLQKKMIVDCERARTVDGWLPRRLGGGMGGMSRRFTKKAFIIRQENVTKRKKSQQIKYGIRYRGAIAEVSKKREQKIGLQKFISQKRKESRYHRRNFP